MNDRAKTKAKLIEELGALRREVDDLRAANEEHRQAEPSLRALLDATTEWACLLAADGAVLAANAPFARDCRRPLDELIGADVYDLLPQSTSEHMKALCEHVIATGKPVRREGDDGGRFFLDTAHPICDSHGEVARLAICRRELSEQRGVELAWREADTLLIAWMDNMPSVAFIKDLYGHYTFVNRAFEELMDLEPGEIIGRTDFDLFPMSVDTAEQMRANDREVVEACSTLSLDETVVVHGEERYYVTVKFPLLDAEGQITSVAGVATDITDRVRADEALRESEERHRLLLEHCGVGIAYFDLEGNVLLMNNRACEELQLDSEKATGKCCADLFGPEWGQVIKNRIGQVADSGETATWEDRFEMPGGTKSFLHTFSNVTGPDGDSTGIQLVCTDITERVRTEQERDEQRRMVHTVLDASLDIITFQDRDLVYRLCNRRFREYLGLSAEEILGKTDMDIFPPEYGRQSQEEDRRVMSTGEPLAVERLMESPHEDIWYEIVKNAVRDENGEISGVLSIAHDLTRHKRAEQALEEERVLLRTLVDTLPDHVYVKDAEGRFLLANRTLARDLGLEGPEDVTGKRDSEIHPPDLAERYRTDDQSVIRSGEPLMIGDDLFEHPTGERRSLATIKVPLRDVHGKITGVVGTSRDITEQKMRDDELQLRARLLDAAGEWIVLMDQDGTIIYANESLCRTLGRPKGSLVGESINAIDTSGSADGFAADIQRVGPAESIGFESELVRHDGVPRRVEIQAQQVPTDSGPRLLAVGRDITDRKHLEEQLLQSQKLEVVGRLAGGIAHDFNNLLTIILGHSAFVKMSLTPGDPSLEDIEQVLKAGERAARLIGQLLAFSRRQMIAPKSFSLNQLVLDMSKMLRRLIGEHIELAILPGEGTTQVQADPGQVEQVVINLAVNARDAMPEGGTLTLRTSHVTLDERDVQDQLGLEPGEYVRLTVSDTGVGMDEEVRAHVFEPFYTTKDVGKGTGLGLATVYGIVKQHGGHIWVCSEPGKGTTLDVYLPRGGETTGELAPADGLEDLALGSETILLVEDEPSVRSTGVRMLKGLGYSVLEATNGEEALRLVEEHEGEIDLLLTDVVMPRLGGLELADRLRAGQPGCRVLFVSGYTDDLAARRRLMGEDVALLEKPFTLESLADAVREVLDT